MSENRHVLIVGGGIVGTGLAWALAERGVEPITVVDLDLAGVYASSELNAGGARATWWQPVNIESCRATLDFFAEHADEFSFRRLGYLWLYTNPALWARALEKQKLQNALGLQVEAWPPAMIGERFPFLDAHREELRGATYSPGDGLVNPNAVRQWYRARAQECGVRFLNRHYVTGVETALASGPAGMLRRVHSIRAIELPAGDPADERGVIRGLLTHHHLSGGLALNELALPAELVVNALGAWSPIFSAKIGVRDVTEPVRRQISLVDVREADRPTGLAADRVGMVVDASGLYFHPEGPHFLAGYSTPDEPPGYDFAYDGDRFFESEIWPRLAHRSSAFERCGHVRGWAGLYAVTPDCSGIAGRIGGFSNLFEAHSFTGRGVMQSYGIARNVAALIDTGRFEDIDLAPLTRDRFDDRSRWVLEELHI